VARAPILSLPSTVVVSSIRNCKVTRSWFFFTSTEKEASPMAEILPETEAALGGFFEQAAMRLEG
jgi:hypothetical protein